MAICGIQGLADVILVIMVMGVTLHTQYTLKTENINNDSEEEELRLLFNAMLTIGTLMWPVVWDFTVGLDNLVACPRMLPAFFWLPLMNIAQMHFIPVASGETGGKGHALAIFQQKELGDNAAMLISAAFAMGSLLFSSRRSNYSATHIIMYGLVLCLAFVIPKVHVPADTRSAVVWKSGQFIVMNYAFGLVIAGISSDLLTNTLTNTLADASANPDTVESTPTPATKNQVKSIGVSATAPASVERASWRNGVADGSARI
jgi:hypothetical protein